MGGEIRSVLRLHRHLNSLPSLPPDGSPDDMVCEVPGDDGIDSYLIQCLNASSRSAIYIVVIVPKFCIAVFLLLSGCRWLMATESFADLIMNALALEFIVGIDELLFDSAFPESMVVFVENMYFAPAKKVLPNTKEEKSAQMRCDYYRSMFLVTLVVIFVVVYLYMFQQVIPGFNWYRDIGGRCRNYFDETFNIPCKTFTVWPFTQNDCFDYGQS